MEIINKVKYTDDAFGEYWRKIFVKKRGKVYCVIKGSNEIKTYNL